MDNQHQPSRDSVALARKHVRALTDGGVSRQALLRALLEEEANNGLPPLPSQASPQPQLKSNSTLTRAFSLSHARPQKSHWSGSDTRTYLLPPRPKQYSSRSTRVIFWTRTKLWAGNAHEENDRPTSSDQLSTSTANSGSRASFLSSQTSVSSRSSTITQFPGLELSGSRPTSTSTRAYWCTS